MVGSKFIEGRPLYYITITENSKPGTLSLRNAVKERSDEWNPDMTWETAWTTGKQTRDGPTNEALAQLADLLPVDPTELFSTNLHYP